MHGLAIPRLVTQTPSPYHRAMGRVGFLITGGLGFIGSAYVRKLVEWGHRPLIVDACTYAGDERRLVGLDAQYDLEVIDISDPGMLELIETHQPEHIVHFAAESHVTRGETSPENFWQTNVRGTENLLRCAQHASVRTFLHVSTDEIYGPCLGAPFKEDEKLPGTEQATSAYAKSKSEADDVAMSFRDRVPVLILRPTNCFGPWQHPEKAIPRWVSRSIRGHRLPVWGSGRQRRSWLYVDDICEAVSLLIDRGELGNAYNVGPDQEPPSNLEVAESIAEIAGSAGSTYLTAYDRPDHDVRYALNSEKIRGLGWRPRSSFTEALSETFDWYRENEWWWLSLIPDAEQIYDDSAARGTFDSTEES